MKRNKIYILTIVFIFLLMTNVFAETLKLTISSDKTEFKKNDEITIEVNWEQGMQAADYILNYDSKKLEFIESDVEDIFLDKKEEGKIRTAWFSLDDTDKTSIKYKFKVLKTGKLEFTANVEGGFANGEMQSPDNYENGKLTIGKSNTLIIVIIVAIVIVAIIVLLMKKSKKRKK